MRNVLDMHKPISQADWRETRDLRASVGRNARVKIKSQRPACLLLTGRASPRSPNCSNRHQNGHHTYILNGDLMRTGLFSDLDYSIETATRRVSQTARTMVGAGLIVIAAVISPLREE